MMRALGSILRERKYQLGIILVLTFLAYSNIFPNNFVGDDETFIVNWDLIRDVRNIPPILFDQSVHQTYGGGYRPIRTLFLLFNYQLWGTNPLGYHLNSLVVQITNTILVYFIVEQIIKRIRNQESGIRVVPFVSALLFGLHPIHIEAITFMLGSIDSIGFIFYLASFYFYMRFRNSQRRLTLYAPSYIASVTLAVLAFFANEFTISLPGVIVFCELFFRRMQGIKLRDVAALCVPYFASLSLYLFIRVGLMGIAGKGGYLADSFYLTMLTMTRAFMKYLQLLIFPINLSMNHTIAEGVQVWIDPFTNMQAIRSQSIFDPPILFNISIIVSLIIFGIVSRRKIPLAGFAIGLFFIAMLPASYIIPLGTILQERYAYLGSFGFVLLLSALFHYLYRWYYPKRLIKIAQLSLLFLATLYTFSYAHLTYKRNFDWKDPITMWSSIVRQIPNHVMSNYQLASMHTARGNTKEAIHYYNRVTTLEPRIPNVYYEMGRIFQQNGKKQEAAQYYQQALSLYPDLILAKVALEEVTGKSDGMSWTQAELAHALIIAYPKAWKFTAIPSGGVFVDEKDSFQVEITVDKKLSRLPAEEYVKRDTKNHGRLVQEGLAQIPNTQAAFAKVFEDNGVSKLKLYLFKEGIIIKLLVFPSNSKQMSTLNEMIRSIMVRADVSQ